MDDTNTNNVFTSVDPLKKLKYKTQINYKTSPPLNILNTGCDKKCLTILYGCILLVAFIVLSASIWIIHRRKQRKMRRLSHLGSPVPKLGRRREKFPNENSKTSSGVLGHQQIPPSKSSGRRFSWYIVWGKIKKNMHFFEFLAEIG